MEQYSRRNAFLKIAVFVVVVAIATADLFAGFLLYKGYFDRITYSNWLFIAAMAYIAIGGLSAYGTFMNTNSYSHKYVSSVMTGNYETRKRIDDMLINSGFSFMIKMICIGVLLFIISGIADTIL